MDRFWQFFNSYVIYTLLLGFSLFGIYRFFKEGIGLIDIFLVVVLFLISYSIVYRFCLLFLKEKKSKDIYEKIFGYPVLILHKIIKLYFEVLVIIIFICLYFAPTLLLNVFLNDSHEIKLSILYLINVITVMIFAYKANKVENFVVYLYGSYSTDALKKINQKIDYRFLTYIMMITIYIFYNLVVFSGYNVSASIIDSFTVLKEVFVTFIAIDSALQIYSSNKNKGSNKI